MTTVRTIATHQVVQRVYPRPVTEQDERAMLAGRIIDTTVSRCSHEARIGRRPTTTALLAEAEAAYDDGLAEASLDDLPAERSQALAQVAGVLKAFRASPLYGLPRPRSRFVLVNDEVGMYAQPDFWDGRARFFEMKSYRPAPVPPEVALQIECFQLAFPGLEAVLIGFDRHHLPVTTSVQTMPALTPDRRIQVLAEVLVTGRELGEPKVLEYLGAPAAAYVVPKAAMSVEAPDQTAGTRG